MTDADYPSQQEPGTATNDPSTKALGSSESPEVAALLEQLRERVQQRRAAGEYPPGLEDDLEGHFRRVVYHRPKPHTDSLQADIDALDSHMSFSRERMQVNSEVIGGEIFHRALNKALARQSEAILQQMQEFADAVRRALHSLTRAVADPSTHVHAELIGHLETLLERLASYERAPVGNEAALGDLRRRVENLERAHAERAFNPWFKYEDFEAEVGRSAEELAGTYGPDADNLVNLEPVLDIGCGRGEFLGLLRERNVECRGIEIDAVQAEEARSRGFDVATGDGVRLLAATDDQSLGAIVLFQVAEHLSQGQLADLVCIAYDKLRPGGKMIVETPNPQCLYILAHSFWLDPTHDHLVHPIYLRFLFESAGFSEVVIEWRHPPPDDDVLKPVGDNGDSEGNRNVERVNQLLFNTQDYAIVATR